MTEFYGILFLICTWALFIIIIFKIAIDDKCCKTCIFFKSNHLPEWNHLASNRCKRCKDFNEYILYDNEEVLQ
jgi:hypothetical protein